MAFGDGLTPVYVEEFGFGQQGAASFTDGVEYLRGGDFFSDDEGQVFHDRRVVADGCHGL